MRRRSTRSEARSRWAPPDGSMRLEGHRRHQGRRTLRRSITMTTTSLHRRQLAAVTVLAAGAAIGVTGYAASAQAAPAGASAGVTQTSSTVVQKAAPGWARLDLKPSSPALKDCFPHASAKVTVKLTADEVGSDRFQIRARGLQPRTPYTVFLLEKAGAPFGAAEYIGD